MSTNRHFTVRRKHNFIFMKIRALFLCLSVIGTTAATYSQSCCSGGVPYASNIGLPVVSGGIWQTNLSYDLNILRTLKEGSATLKDRARERKTQSMLFQTGYAFSSRWSADLFFSWVKQERTITQFGKTDYVSTSGLGDAAILVKYNILEPGMHKFSLTVAAGPKIPTGRSDFRREDGLPLNADLQPGSGSWDGLVWLNSIYSFSFRPSFIVSVTGIYSYKGKNNNYLGGQTYQVGNEFQLVAILSDRLMTGKKMLDISLLFRFRQALNDRYNDLTMPNTGGTWLFITPGLSYNLSRQIAVMAHFETPLFSAVEGTQLSPTFRLNTGIFIRIEKKKELFKL